MKTLLLATDFSEGSVNADHHAKELAGKTGASIIYFHALSPPVMDVNVPAELVNDIYKTTNEHFEHELKKLATETEKSGIKSSYVLSLSDLGSGISEVVDQKKVDLIIMGKTANPGFFEKIFGSTAEHLVHKFEKPLLIIPETFHKDAFSHILYATRLEFDEIETLKEVYAIKKAVKAKMTLSKVDEAHEPDVHNDEQFEADILTHFPAGSFDILHQQAESFVEGIEKVADKVKASLLVVATSHRNFLEGLVDPGKSKKLVAETGLPVLVYNV